MNLEMLQLNIFAYYFLFAGYCVSVTLGLQCYQCSGMTNYDPDNCFHPDNLLIYNECDKGDWCEKTIHHIDRFQSVVSRGCSSNCDKRTYIYTDDFQTHCCKDKNRCNSARALHGSLLTLLSATCLALLSRCLWSL